MIIRKFKNLYFAFINSLLFFYNIENLKSKMLDLFPQAIFDEGAVACERTTIGRGVIVGKNTKICSSTIGERSKILSKSHIYKSQISDASIILNNSTIISTKIGRRSYVAPKTHIQNCTIGKFCSIGPEIIIGMGKHPSRTFVSTYPAFFRKNNDGCLNSFVNEDLFEEIEPIDIGNDVWIGARSIVMDGVKIGSGAIIGAGSLVNKDVEEYAIVGGIPSKLIRYRFEPEEIDYLLNLTWWDKDESWIKRHAKKFCNIKTLRLAKAVDTNPTLNSTDLSKNCGQPDFL